MAAHGKTHLKINEQITIQKIWKKKFQLYKTFENNHQIGFQIFQATIQVAVAIWILTFQHGDSR